MSKKLLIYIKATMLTIGLSACGATTDGFEEEADVAAAPGAPIVIAGCHFQVDRPHKSTQSVWKCARRARTKEIRT